MPFSVEGAGVCFYLQLSRAVLIRLLHDSFRYSLVTCQCVACNLILDQHCAIRLMLRRWG